MVPLITVASKFVSLLVPINLKNNLRQMGSFIKFIQKNFNFGLCNCGRPYVKGA